MSQTIERIKKLPSRLIYAVICLLSLVFMVWKGDAFSFWIDELAQISYSGTGKTLLETALIVDPTPPFFSLVANIWYNITPYGQRWLLLLPQLATVLAVYVAALWGERLGGRRVGIWTAILLAFSRMVIAHCGFEFRSYGFYILFSALCFYCHSHILEKGMNKAGRWGIFYWLSLLCLVYSHLLGSVIFFALAAQDMVQILRRRIPWTRLFLYFFAGILFLPWVFYLLNATGTAVTHATASWMYKPTLWNIPDLCGYFCDNHVIVCSFFFVGGLTVLGMITEALKKKEISSNLEQILVPCVTAAFMILGIFVYGKIRSDYGSLWTERYFTGLFPCFAVVSALGADAITRFVDKRSCSAASIMSILCFLLITVVNLGRVVAEDLPMVRYYHREATEIMYQQPDIHDENTLVLCIHWAYLDGWEDFYCTQKGQREPLGIRGAADVSREELLQYDVVYYEYGYGRGDTIHTDSRKALEEEYIVDMEWDDAEIRRYVKKK